MHALIADDDRMAREVLAKTTQAAWGSTRRAVADGAQAWEHLRASTAPTLAILDWMMPQMDGPEVLPPRARGAAARQRCACCSLTARERPRRRRRRPRRRRRRLHHQAVRPRRTARARQQSASGCSALQERLADRVAELQDGACRT